MRLCMRFIIGLKCEKSVCDSESQNNIFNHLLTDIFTCNSMPFYLRVFNPFGCFLFIFQYDYCKAFKIEHRNTV